MASLAETDILNPVQGWSDALGLNPNWSYGWIRKTASNKKLAQPRLGRRYSRELANGGYSASLNFIDQPYAQVLRLKRFYEQFQNGYFTLINWDGCGRHHVGNFTTPPNEVETANGKWTIQGLTFEEAAQARMLRYPSDFMQASRVIYAVDDYLVPQIASQQDRVFSSLHRGFTAQLRPGFSNANAPVSFESLNLNPDPGDFAQMQYVGWGFRIPFRVASGLGQCVVSLDGVQQITIDQSTGGQVAGLPLPAGATLANGTLTMLQVPLDVHRIKISYNGTPGANGGGSALAVPPLSVLI
jgi:hypothetical protein